VIYIPLIGLPPSINEAYRDVPFHTPQGIKTRRKLSKIGEKYKNETTSFFSREYPIEMTLIKPNVCTGWAVVLDMPQVLNKGWPDKAESRYKAKDASNRVKLLEDCLSAALGFDDAQFFLQLSAKREGREYTHIWVWNIEVEGWLPNGLVRDLSRMQPY
jgi:Holliday junction resolvase RusA-like endonuclease